MPTIIHGVVDLEYELWHVSELYLTSDFLLHQPLGTAQSSQNLRLSRFFFLRILLTKGQHAHITCRKAAVRRHRNPRDADHLTSNPWILYSVYEKLGYDFSNLFCEPSLSISFSHFAIPLLRSQLAEVNLLLLSLNFDHVEAFDYIANLDIVVVLDTDTALVALVNFLGVVLETSEG